MSTNAELKLATEVINTMPTEEFYNKFIELAKSFVFSALLGDITLLREEEKDAIKKTLIENGVPRKLVDNDESLLVVAKIVASRIVKIATS